MHKITLTAAGLIEPLLKAGKVSGPVLADLQWYAKSLTTAAQAIKRLCDFAAIYELAVHHLNEPNPSPADREKIFEVMRTFSNDLEAAKPFIHPSDRVPLDYLGGALCGRKPLLKFFSDNLSKIKLSLETRRRFMTPPRKYFPWWEGQH